MNFFLNDSAAEFELDNRDLKFYPNGRKIEFQLNGSQDLPPSEDDWVLGTGIWNDSAYWKDEAFWRDTP